jgi:hypothetical protein
MSSSPALTESYEEADKSLKTCAPAMGLSIRTAKGIVMVVLNDAHGVESASSVCATRRRGHEGRIHRRGRPLATRTRMTELGVLGTFVSIAPAPMQTR